MKRLLLAIAGYALYRWWTSQPDRKENDIARTGSGSRRGNGQKRRPA